MIRSLKIDLINHCNAKCSFCPYHGVTGVVTAQLQERREQFSMLMLSDMETLVRGCEQDGIKPKFKFSGRGEATIHQDFSKILRFISRNGFQTRIITNGLLLEKYVSVLIECHTEVVVSIHGREKIHDATIGEIGALHKAEIGLQKIAGHSVSVEIGIILTPQNIDDLEEIVTRYATSGNVKVRIHHNFDARIRASLSPYAVYETLSRIKERFPAIRTVPDLSEEALCRYYGTSHFVINPHSCTRYAEELEISSDGTVTVCNNTSFGNIRSTSFSQIVSGTTRASFIALMKNELCSPEGLSSARCDRCCYQTQR
ncbi:hypothetical protein A2609_01155 [Candidatus Kaiserbacteria bacterium RIFOXYD1_FULL_47_14]|uniref:Radical SAM core domain-containing protein n=1 Tax=Candidatus Kaiserbacteria bacterium RIFOXYD1_FULL_47_14 TaxID=1798533 RepID=A0A1F6G6U4_9BACT|nr:MAG: hypothetical protein A2609_01155 [Candidatus Kaiserbacteria bacterium RIFOXYD1_FULL_47_14]